MARPKDTPTASTWRRATKAGLLIRAGKNMTEACRQSKIPVMTFSDYLSRSLASEYGVDIRVEMNRSDAGI